MMSLSLGPGERDFVASMELNRRKVSDEDIKKFEGMPQKFLQRSGWTSTLHAGHTVNCFGHRRRICLRSMSVDLKNVRHLREILVTDARGKATGMMQYSSQNVSHFRPNFVEVPLDDQARARELYLRWGGRRREGMRIGMTVIIPNR